MRPTTGQTDPDGPPDHVAATTGGFATGAQRTTAAHRSNQAFPTSIDSGCLRPRAALLSDCPDPPSKEQMMGTDETVAGLTPGGGGAETEIVPPAVAREDHLAWSTEPELWAEDWDAAADAIYDNAAAPRSERPMLIAAGAAITAAVVLVICVAFLIATWPKQHDASGGPAATRSMPTTAPTWIAAPQPPAAPDPDVVPPPAANTAPAPVAAPPPPTTAPTPSFLPDQQPSTTNDYEFLDALRQHLTVYNPGRTITAAHYLCGAMRQGTSRANALTYIKTHGEFTDQGANDFLNTAITYYCPEES